MVTQWSKYVVHRGITIPLPLLENLCNRNMHRTHWRNTLCIENNINIVNINMWWVSTNIDGLSPPNIPDY